MIIKKFLNGIISLLFIGLLVAVTYFWLTNYSSKNNPVLDLSSFNINSNEDNDKKENDYNECLNKQFSENELTDDLVQIEDSLINLITQNKYNASFYYEDITTGFSYSYLADKTYYGCSLIKILDALYLIDKASIGEINLDEETIVYTSNYKVAYSSGMAKRSIGEKITLRDLITYAVSVSDNTAHLMLIDYIGFNNLKSYGQSLGAKVVLTGGDKFGNQTAYDTNIYLKEAYNIITNNEQYGEFLKEIMDNDERNDFNTEDIKIYHKYGSYDINYHDIGLSLEERPYAISILTLHELSNHKEVIQSIHSKIRELHFKFYENRKNNCYKEVYEN